MALLTITVELIGVDTETQEIVEDPALAALMWAGYVIRDRGPWRLESATWGKS